MSAMQTEKEVQILNNKLSQDILWMIFDFYAETDGPQDPLEKLLFVCKHWSLAARQHRQLWTKFPIIFSSTDDLRFWFSRTPNRIKLCGEQGPAEVEFVRVLFENIKMVDRDMISKLSEELVGRDGSLINRWSRITVESIPSSAQEVWVKALSRPTPNLRFLRITEVSPMKPILPFAPSLEELSISTSDCTLGNDFGQLKILNLRGFSSNIYNISSVLTAKRLTTLSLVNCGRNINLPPSFPVLEAVSFEGAVHTSPIESFSAPRLRSLTIYLRTEESITALKNCRGIDFERLQILSLGCWIYSKSESASIMQSIKDIFRAVNGVRQLRALNMRALRTLLLCIQERINPTIERRGCQVQLLYNVSRKQLTEQRFFISADATEEDIRRVRLRVNLDFDDTWDELISGF